jgi:heptosyltransferase III
MNLLLAAENFLRRIGSHARRRRERWRLRDKVRASAARLREIRSALRPDQRLVCIGMIENLGDIVACEPVARHLRREYPAAHLLWIVREPFRGLVECHPALDGILVVSCLAEYSRLLARTEGVEFIDLHIHHRVCGKFGDVHRKLNGDPSIDPSNYFNHGALLEAFSRSAGLPPLAEAPQLHLSPAHAAEVAPLLPPRPYFIVHASTNEVLRDWKPERWLELVDALSAARFPLVEIGFHPIVAHQRASVRNLCGRLTVAQMAEIIRHCSGFIGLDSGPAHIANACSRPSVILMGSYREFRRYMPYTGFLREHAAAMIEAWDGPVAEIPVERVLARALNVFGRQAPPPA